MKRFLAGLLGLILSACAIAQPAAAEMAAVPKAYGILAGWNYGPGQLIPTLSALSLSTSSGTVSGGFSATVLGCMPGDTLAIGNSVGGKYSLTSATCGASLVGSGLTAGTDAPSVVETFTGATNSPLTTPFSVTVGAAPTSYFGLAATRVGIASNLGTNQYMNMRSVHTATATISQIKVAASNFYYANGQPAEASAGPVTTEALAVEYPSGTCTPLTFGGATTGAIATDGSVFSDLVTLPTPIPNGATFWVREFRNQPTGIPYYVAANTNAQDSGNGSTGSQANATANGGGGACPTFPTNTLTGIGSFPVFLILAQTSAPSAIIVGDSVSRGHLNNNDGNFNQGIIAPTLAAAGIPFLNVSSDSLQAVNYSTQAIGRLTAFPYFSHAFNILGGNDIQGGALSVAATVAAVGAVNADFPSTTKVIQVPLQAWTASPTTFWTTTADQALANAKSSNTLAFNALVRSGSIPGNNAGYMDPFSILQNGSGIWNVSNPRAATDCAVTTAAGLLTSASLNFTSADVGAGFFLDGVGAAGATNIGNPNMQVSAVTNATTVNLSGAATSTTSTPGSLANFGSVARTGLTCGIGALTWDGIHPNPLADAVIKASGLVDVSRITYP